MWEEKAANEPCSVNPAQNATYRLQKFTLGIIYYGVK